MPQRVLAAKLAPASSRTRQATLVFATVALTALGARLVVPIAPVPFTLQTFSVLTLSLLLGSRVGVLGQAVYLLGGAAGFGLFAGGGGGAAALVGPTGGYLIGFVPAAYVVGRLADRGYRESFAKAAGAMAIGAAIVFALGVAWLSRVVGWHDAAISGFALFLPSEAFKIAVGALVVSGVSRRSDHQPNPAAS